MAEECGVDSVFVSDHLQPWRHDGGHAPFAMTWLGARTERIVMGTSVLTPTFRYHPGIVAQAFATLGCLFPDRVVRGIGTGESFNEAALGLKWPDGKERFTRFREAVRLIKQLWAEDRVTFEGEYYRTDRATIYDKPGRPVPLYLAASGPAATRYAGRAGDGYITTSGKGEELYTETLLPAVREGAEQAGRSVDDLDLMIEVKVSFDHDRDAAMEATRFWGALGLSAEQKHAVEDPMEMQRLADELSTEQTAKRFIVSTDLTSTSHRSGNTSPAASPTWYSMRPGRIRRSSRGSMAARSCRACKLCERTRSGSAQVWSPPDSGNPSEARKT